MENKISLLVALKNNLDYNKHFYTTTRAIYPEVEICFSSFNSTDGTDEWLDTLKDDPYTKVFHTTEIGNFSDNFNKAASLATKDYVAFLHNDIVVAPGFIENLEKHCNPDTVVSYTTIEPPIFAGHERPGKIIYDLGVELETFDINKFYEFAATTVEKYKDQIEPGIVFFMCMPKDKYLEIGGLDNLYNPMFCEDDDLILRWKLMEMNLITSLDAITYHFVSKTSRFSDEYQAKTAQIELHSNRNFLRKWGNKDFKAKYDIGFVIENCDRNLIALVELFGEVYANNAMPEYIKDEQLHTKFNLSERVKQYNAPKTNQILIYFDGTKFTNDHVGLLYQFPEIIANSGQIGTFELDIFKLDISGMDRLDHQLIHNHSQYYTNQLLKS
jgi:GT2 family glycosyltransferase